MKIAKQVFGIVLLITIILLAGSCKKTQNNSYYDNVECNEADDTLNTYSLKIGAILDANCVSSGCHNSGSHKSAVNLEGFSNTVSSFNDQPVLCTIYQDKGCKPMPKGGSKLSDDKIHDITCWAKNGCPQ